MLIPVMLAAGPPFRTDDPEPVDFRHWEFYLASSQEYMRTESDLTCPHIEVNYGAAPDLQLHLIAPVGYVHNGSGTHVGYSDTELGIKFRFMEETETGPQIGTFPIVELPTGSPEKDLGTGTVRLFLPLWAQKSWGSFTTYGGGGVWYNPGDGQRNWGFAGWEAQYDFSSLVTLGGEIYYQTPDTPDARATAGMTLGGFINPDDHDHILFSIGNSIRGEHTTSIYIAYQVTL